MTSCSAIVQARVDPRIKAIAIKNLKKVGLSLSEFIRLQIADIACESPLPRPNQETLEAVKRVNAGKGKRFKNPDELFAYLERK